MSSDLAEHQHIILHGRLAKLSSAQNPVESFYNRNWILNARKSEIIGIKTMPASLVYKDYTWHVKLGFQKVW